MNRDAISEKPNIVCKWGNTNGPSDQTKYKAKIRSKKYTARAFLSFDLQKKKRETVSTNTHQSSRKNTQFSRKPSLLHRRLSSE